MTSAISSGLQGYDRGEAIVNNAAAQIARGPYARPASQKPGNTTPADSSDLSSTAVSLLQGKNTATANLATIRVADEMQKSLIDMLA